MVGGLIRPCPAVLIASQVRLTTVGMAGRFDLLLGGNRKQRPSETEFVAVRVN